MKLLRLSLALLCLLAGPALRAATFTVTNTNDDSLGHRTVGFALRDAGNALPLAPAFRAVQWRGTAMGTNWMV